MLFLLVFRLIKENIPSSLPQPPKLQLESKTCPGAVTFERISSLQFKLYPEYQMNDGDWQDDTLFTNLTPDTLYKFTARYRSYPTSIESQYSYICKSTTPTYPPIMTINLVKTIRQDTNDIQTYSASKDQHSMNIKSIKRKQTYSCQYRSSNCRNIRDK